MKAFFRNIRFGFKKTNLNEYGIAAPPSEATPKDQLRQILPCMVTRMEKKRPGCSANFQLMASSLSPSRLVFRGSEPLKEHECLELEILLPGIGPLKLTSQVQFVVETKASNESFCSQVAGGTAPSYRLAGATYSGQLELWCTEDQKRQILDYLTRQNLKVRFPVEPSKAL
jgi:hypothetical protein